MKKSFFKSSVSILLFTLAISCSKSDRSETANMTDETSAQNKESAKDAVSSAATTAVEGKQFIKTADVTMEVKDVYDATIFIEKALSDLGGFVTSSKLNSEIFSEKTFTISDEKSMIVRKFNTDNGMEVRLPTEKLGEFLTIINDKKVFLNSRIILAEDVTANLKLAELEAERNKKNGGNITRLKQDSTTVILADKNARDGNYQQIETENMKDQLKYSTIKIYLKEPQARIAQIPVANTKNLDDQYQYNFFYDAKNALTDGFYLIQRLIIGLLNIWPFLIIAAVIIFLIKKKKLPKLNKEKDLN